MIVLFPTKIVPWHSFTNHKNCTTIPQGFFIKRKIRLVFAWWSVSRRRQANMALRRPSEHGDWTGGQLGSDSLQNFSAACVSYSTWSLGFEKSSRFNGHGSLEYRLTVGNNDARRRGTLLLIRRSRAVERIAFATVHNTDTSKTRLYTIVLVNNNEGKSWSMCYVTYIRVHTSTYFWRTFDLPGCPRGRDLTGRKLIVAATSCRTAGRIFVIFQRRTKIVPESSPTFEYAFRYDGTAARYVEMVRSGFGKLFLE